MSSEEVLVAMRSVGGFIELAVIYIYILSYIPDISGRVWRSMSKLVDD